MEETPAFETGATQSKRFSHKREAIIAAAIGLFNERGVVGTTLSEVAARVNLIKTGVTYYFRRKEDLAQACFMGAIDTFDGIIASAAQLQDIEDRIHQLIRASVELNGQIAAGTRPPIMYFHEIRALPQPQSTEVFDRYTGMFRRLRQLLKDPRTADWSREDANARSHLLLSLLHAISAIAHRYAPEDLGRVAQRLGDVVIHGVGTAHSQWLDSGLEAQWLEQMPERTLSNQFLKAATELINEQGYAGASVNRISERLNLTKGGFYHYHDNKDEVVKQCFDRSLSTLRKAVNLTETFGGSGWEHLCSIARGLVLYQLSDDGPLLRWSANSALPDAEHRTQVAEDFGRMMERVSGIVVSGMIDGSVRPVDPRLAAFALLSGVMAAAELRRWVRSADAGNACELYARPIMMGLLSPASR